MMLAGAGKQWTTKSIKPFIYRLLRLLSLIMADFDGRQKSRPQAGFLMPVDYICTIAVGIEGLTLADRSRTTRVHPMLIALTKGLIGLVQHSRPTCFRPFR